tara:strand:+ start:47 stop:658 length:612 start_codon:yes stop_codon:yes gene_type:complete
MFEINKLNFNKVYEGIYVMNSFYKDPHLILDLFDKVSPSPFKWSLNSKNLINFSDLRHVFRHPDFLQVTQNLKEYFKIDSAKTHHDVVQTNIFKMNCKSFNDYKNNYWMPHDDDIDGLKYTFIIYLNKKGCDGTNFYDTDNFDYHKDSEHAKPWVDKKNFKLLYNVKSQFNMCVAFKTNLLHGMAINSDEFFNDFRINQVTFL